MFPGSTIAPDGSLILLLDVNRLVAGKPGTSIAPLIMAWPAKCRAHLLPGRRGRCPGQHSAGSNRRCGPEEKVIVLADDSISVASSWDACWKRPAIA